MFGRLEKNLKSTKKREIKKGEEGPARLFLLKYWLSKFCVFFRLSLDGGLHPCGHALPPFGCCVL